VRDVATSRTPSRLWKRLLLSLTVVFVGVFLAGLAVENAGNAASSSTLEAEQMSGNGVLLSDRSASNHRARLFKKNGSAWKEFTGSLSGVTVRAKGDVCSGAPRMVVSIDGHPVMSRLVKAERKWSYQRASLGVQSGEHMLRVSFTNDGTTRQCDRRLKVDRVNLGLVQNTVAKPTCEKSLQAMVDAASTGAVVEVPGGCVYRETISINKPLTLKGGPGAEIRGSDVWPSSDFTSTGGIYKSSKVVPPLAADTTALCEGSSDRCHHPEQVYLDGVALKQVAATSTPARGEFKIDSNRHVYLADDPAGRTVEVTTRNMWIKGTGNGVTVEDFIFKHAAADGIKPVGDHWTVEDCDLSYAHQANLRMSQGTGYVAQRNKIHHGGQVGMGGNNSSVQISSNDIYENNIEKYSHSWSAGGIKLSNANTMVIDGNHIHHNHGNGLWTDVPNSPQDVTISNNRVDHNEDHGIRFEVSINGDIYGNKVWENGWVNGGYGISVSASSDTRVHDNTVAWNESGIMIHNPLRTDVHSDEGAYNTVDNVEVDHNDVFQVRAPGSRALGWVVPGNNPYANLYDPAANNRGHDNRYWYSSAEGSGHYRYEWNNQFAELRRFEITPGEESSRYLSTDEKQQALDVALVPASPEPH
jgi:parallel beta-helix repeat protein